MFFFLSKILYYLAMPITIIVALLLAGIVVRKKSLKRKGLLAGFGLLIFFTNPFIANEAMLGWEVPVQPLADLPVYQTGVVLTGITNVYKTPHDRTYFTRGADRIVHALQLYRAGIIKQILISGGTGSVTNQGVNEAQELRNFLLLAQVPDSVIILERKSKNTHENAAFTAALLKQRNITNKVLLITSAFHMRRSAGCFSKEGVLFDTFSTDFYSFDRRFYTPDRIIVPQEDALYTWAKLAKELLGYSTYKLMGYI